MDYFATPQEGVDIFHEGVSPQKQSKMINHSTMIFDYNKLKNQENLIAHSTKFLTQSRIPLAKDHKAKIMVYKSIIGGLEHVVIKIGSPKIQNTVKLL